MLLYLVASFLFPVTQYYLHEYIAKRSVSTNLFDANNYTACKNKSAVVQHLIIQIVKV